MFGYQGYYLTVYVGELHFRPGIPEAPLEGRHLARRLAGDRLPLRHVRRAYSCLRGGPTPECKAVRCLHPDPRCPTGDQVSQRSVPACRSPTTPHQTLHPWEHCSTIDLCTTSSVTPLLRDSASLLPSQVSSCIILYW